MTEKHLTDLTKRALGLGFRQGYEIANRTEIDESIPKADFLDMVLETVLNSLDSTVFKTLSTELDEMNETFPAFDSWKVFADGVIEGASENYSDRTADD
ncbi:MAG: hypothetical protein QNJ26_01185 [Desulfobacterales bacterium]|nr:hypothetical protein [Desulfobacterales bacterium]